MRLIVATDGGVQLLRWIEGERSAQLQDASLEPEAVTCLFRTSAGDVYASTRSGKLYGSEDRGESWIPRARDPERRAIRSLNGRPGPEPILYAGTEPAALLVSRDGGITISELEAFRRMGEDQTWEGYGERRPHVEALAPDPHDPRRLYAGVEVGGAYRSDDDGGSWREVSDGLNEDVHHLAVDPRHASRVFVATGGGFYRSEDRGRGWQERSPEGAGRCYCTAMLVPEAERGPASELLLATATSFPGGWGEPEEGAGAGLFRGSEGADAWRPIDLWSSTAGRDAIVVLATSLLEPDDYFVGTTRGELHYAENDGEAWSEVYTGLPAIRDLVVV